MSFQCPVCGLDAELNETNGAKDSNYSRITCPRCGEYFCKFAFEDRERNIKLDNIDLGKICGYIRENPKISISINDLNELQNIKMPAVGEKAEKLLLHFANKIKNPSSQIEISDTNDYMGISWSSNSDELFYLMINYLTYEKKYLCRDYNIDDDGTTLNDPVFGITPKGWDYIDSLRSINGESKTVFVAMRFNQILLDTIYKSAIKPAIEGCGYDAKIMSEHDHITKIDDEIIAQIKKSKFVVADFTEQNPGAYYEAGFARGLGLKVISTCEKIEVDSHKLHFDTRQYRTILWEKDKLDVFKKELTMCIEANIGLAR